MQFSAFSAQMYGLAAGREYQAAQMAGESVVGTAHWTAQKMEMATLVNLHVIDAARIGMERVAAYDAQARAYAETLLDRVSGVVNLYVLAGGIRPSFEGAEEYLGQPAYSVFWHIDLQTGEISVPSGQPKQIFDLRAMVEKAYKESLDGPSVPATFATLGTNRPKLKHRHAVITYGILVVNAIILILMYLDGYNLNDLSHGFWVPRRFGAIYPDWVINRGEWYRLFTAMFVHFGAAHFAANTFGLLVFGSRIERHFGRLAFCVIYIPAGLLGSVFSLFFSQAYSAGASGAIYGLVGALFAYTRITKRSIESINWYTMLVYIGLGLGMGFATPGIDNFAHLGGLVGGLVVGCALAWMDGKYN